MENFLDRVDEKAAAKGAGVKTLWQLAKFIIVAILTTGVQILLVNLLPRFFEGWKTPLTGFLGNIFNEDIIGQGNSTWGYILPYFLSLAIANTINYIINKNKTFKSDAPSWHFVIYFAVLVALILFSTWFQGVFVHWMVGLGLGEAGARSLGSVAAGFIMSLVMFPLQKFVLLKEKKNA